MYSTSLQSFSDVLSFNVKIFTNQIFVRIENFSNYELSLQLSFRLVIICKQITTKWRQIVSAYCCVDRGVDERTMFVLQRKGSNGVILTIKW